MKMVKRMIIPDFYWNLLSQTANVLHIFVGAYFYYRLVFPFLPKKRSSIWVGLVYITVLMIFFIAPVDINGSVGDAIVSAVIFATMYFPDKKDIWKKLFLAVTVYLTEWITWGPVSFLLDIFTKILLYIPGTAGEGYVSFAATAALEMLSIIFEVLSKFVFIKLFHKIYIYKDEPMTKAEAIFILVPFISFASGRWVFRYFIDVYAMDVKQYLWVNHRGYDIILLVYQFMAFAGMLTVIKVYQDIKAAKRQEKEEAVLLRQAEDMERHINEVEELYKDIRGLKHDMRNHVTVLEKLCGENEEALSYVERLKDSIDETALGDIKSGNPITDIILKEKQKAADDLGIGCSLDFRYPNVDNAEFNVFDISIIINNALDNAIEGASECEKGHVYFSSFLKNNAYILEIRNSIAYKRIIDERCGLPVSTKQESGHGFGLFNIRKTSQKYRGDIEIEQSDDEFILTVMLMMQ